MLTSINETRLTGERCSGMGGAWMFSGISENIGICSKQMEILVKASKTDFLPSVLRSFSVYLGSC